MTEIWRDVKDYEGLYQVSNWGRVKSLNYHRSGKTKLLKTGENTDGYLQVILCKKRKRKTCLVHRLVAEAFLDNPENKPEINHIDEDKTNNFVGTPENDYKDGNLEWKWHRDNMNHGTRNERIAKTNTNGKLSKRVLQLTLDGKLIREWISVAECERNGFNHSNVCNCCNGKRKSAYGFIWKYS